MLLSFSKPRIVHRIVLLGASAFVGMVAISGIFLVQRQIDVENRASAERVAAHEQKMVEVIDGFQESLMWEQDFLLNRDMAATEKFSEALAGAGQGIEVLQASASPSMISDLQAITAGFGAYATSFTQLVSANQDLGLDHDSGFEGSMRSSVHSVEKALEGTDDLALRASMLTLRRHEKDFILRRDGQYIEKHAAEVENFKALLKQAFKPGAKRMRASEALTVYLDGFRLYADANLREKAARAAVSSSYAAVEPVVAKVMAGLNAEKAAYIAESARIAQRNVMIVGGLVALAAAGLLVGVWFIGRSISRPAVAITDAMRTLADGQTDLTVPGLARRDEFGAMASALEVFRQSALANIRLEQEAAEARLRSEAERERIQIEADADARMRLIEATNALAGGLERLAAGDLSFQLTEPFSDDFESLRGDLNRTLGQLSVVMSDIAQATDVIDSGTREINGSAGDLSQRTERDAASLEETAAALDQITANVANSARRAEEARAAATNATQNATRTATLVTETVDAMGRIEQSSTRISSIIGVIDEIAFQTNLLALNAGVEAARAGDAGRGFAVVAHEVRELAQRSASAAKEIKELIRTSRSEVEDGARCVRDAGGALNDISEDVRRISTYVEAIATSSREQSAGLAEINAAVNHLDQGTQQNAAMVEENKAASASLAREAQRLRQLVSGFALAREQEPRRRAA